MLYPVAARGCLAVELICVAFVARTRFRREGCTLSSSPVCMGSIYSGFCSFSRVRIEVMRWGQQKVNQGSNPGSNPLKNPIRKGQQGSN